MHWTKNIKLNLIIICVLAVTIVLSNCVANAAQVSLLDAVPAVPNSKEELARASSINEINRYLSQMDSVDIAATVKLFRVIQLLQSNYIEDVSTDSLLVGAIKGAVNTLGDPHSVYLDPKLYKELMISSKGSFGGVGIILGVKDKILTVVAPIEGTPGDKAGIMNGDQIVKIDSKDTKDMALDEAVNMIRGPEGSEVSLTINRTGQEIKEYTLVRSNIQLKTVAGKILENDIGYVRISMFSENTSDDLSKKLHELEEQGMKAVILDLRNNPGGLLGEGVKIAGMFVPKGPIVSVVTKLGKRETYVSSLEAPKYPLVILINGGSASASEIVAGAVQDTESGTLIGTKTFGKGSVQTVVQLDNDSAVKLTAAQYFTPKERFINGVGIEPDITVEIEMADLKEGGKDTQLEKAVDILKGQL